jgi:hypothetical protein
MEKMVDIMEIGGGEERGQDEEMGARDGEGQDAIKKKEDGMWRRENEI